MNTEKILTVAQVVAPIFVTVFLGVLARRRKLLTPEQVQGLQQFALKFGMPCVVFTSCLTADMDGMPLEEVRTPQMRFTLKLPKPVPPLSMIRRSVDLSAK